MIDCTVGRMVDFAPSAYEAERLRFSVGGAWARSDCLVLVRAERAGRPFHSVGGGRAAPVFDQQGGRGLQIQVGKKGAL